MLINPYIEATPLVLHGLVPRLDMKGVARSADSARSRLHGPRRPRHAPALRPASQVHCPVFCESLRSHAAAGLLEQPRSLGVTQFNLRGYTHDASCPASKHESMLLLYYLRRTTLAGDQARSAGLTRKPPAPRSLPLGREENGLPILDAARVSLADCVARFRRGR